jgi:hypothetical protein
MELKDFLNISDSKIRGVVVMKNSNGKIIFERENMIVQSGRKFVRDVFVRNAIPALANFAGLSNYKLTHIAFGNSDVITEYTMTSLQSEGIRIPINETNTTVEESTMFMKFRGSVNRSDSQSGYTVRELGLVLTNPDNEQQDQLFSRIVFDPITIAPGESYEVEYYVYF